MFMLYIWFVYAKDKRAIKILLYSINNTVNRDYYAMKAAALVFILPLHTGQVTLIFSEQSSQIQTCPQGSIMT